jgi:hypothetical protein
VYIPTMHLRKPTKAYANYLWLREWALREGITVVRARQLAEEKRLTGAYKVKYVPKCQAGYPQRFFPPLWAGQNRWRIPSSTRYVRQRTRTAGVHGQRSAGYLSPLELARRWHRSERIVRMWCRRGWITGCKCIHGSWWVPEDARVRVVTVQWVGLGSPLVGPTVRRKRGVGRPLQPPDYPGGES